MIAAKQDPAAAKQQEKQARKAATLNTVEHIARDWHNTYLHIYEPDNAKRILRYLGLEVFPTIGAMPIKDIKPLHIRAMLDKILKRDINSTAEKIRQWVSKVFDYTTRLKLADGNPVSAFTGYISRKKPLSTATPCQKKSRPSFTAV
ncbi:tyrosine-type recombinase/integrase [Neisseria iguanae]|uniref:tyrosine-type recombinase/integrase n=1 Tax=Neisseria iguanae TaxID=90242 RepID=UPI001FE3B028|nr:hypothetical protein [Neisseria iguanae]